MTIYAEKITLIAADRDDDLEYYTVYEQRSIDRLKYRLLERLSTVSDPILHKIDAVIEKFHTKKCGEGCTTGYDQDGQAHAVCGRLPLCAVVDLWIYRGQERSQKILAKTPRVQKSSSMV